MYWLSLLLFTLLGSFMFWIFLYKIVWETWKTRKINPRKKRIKKVRRTFFGKVKHIFGIGLSYVFMLVLFIGIPTFCFYIAVPTWLDLPAVITGNYAEVTGHLTNSATVEMKGKSWGYPYYAYIDGEFYSSLVPLDAFEDLTITVNYLPHTKVIVDML
ncbi:hypothetical protein [Paenibacillus selenitireducens]|uniref:hypothetical protein n=1 Tax=Paenibacillus selenitireducens TaxID=1324314 RepID=UPI00117E6911|nr:hypothetical protein [Paenibacillus selenitireducens]